MVRFKASGRRKSGTRRACREVVICSTSQEENSYFKRDWLAHTIVEGESDLAIPDGAAEHLAVGGADGSRDRSTSLETDVPRWTVNEVRGQ
jgi:hypothetical protein